MWHLRGPRLVLGQQDKVEVRSWGGRHALIQAWGREAQVGNQKPGLEGVGLFILSTHNPMPYWHGVPLPQTQLSLHSHRTVHPSYALKTRWWQHPVCEHLGAPPSLAGFLTHTTGSCLFVSEWAICAFASPDLHRHWKHLESQKLWIGLEEKNTDEYNFDCDKWENMAQKYQVLARSKDS